MSGPNVFPFSKDKIAMADYIRDNTPSDAVFMTGTYHLNAVPTLAGRNIYLGSSLYVYFHGMGDEYYRRKTELGNAFSGTYEELMQFCKENNISYVYVGADEKNSSDYTVNENAINRLEKVYSAGTEALYKID